MNKPVCQGLSILGLSKILMYNFWCDYAKSKYDYMENCVVWIQRVSLYT